MMADRGESIPGGASGIKNYVAFIAPSAARTALTSSLQAFQARARAFANRAQCPLSSDARRHHAPRDPFHVLKRRHGLAEIVERGAGVEVERRQSHPHREREFITFSENTSRHGYYFAQQ